MQSFYRIWTYVTDFISYDDERNVNLAYVKIYQERPRTSYNIIVFKLISLFFVRRIVINCIFYSFIYSEHYRFEEFRN